MPTPNVEVSLDNLQVRTYRPSDQPRVQQLYVDGLLAGQIADNDTGVDIENIEEAYLRDERCGFWVAEVGDQILGMIGVANEGDHGAEIRRLRVQKEYQQSPIGFKLIERALEHCSEQGYLKVVFDTRFQRSAALDLFDRFGFQYTRAKNIHGKELLEFYLDLYRSNNREHE